MERPRSASPATAASRRDFLHQAAGLAAGAGLVGLAPPAQAQRDEPATAASDLLPTITLGSHRVTRLIIGGNPIYGYSHFNRLLSQHQTDWHTPERVVELLQYAERHGINTWQNSYAERTLSDLTRYREAGGRMHWLCLTRPNLEEHPEQIDDAVRRGAIGIAPHGALAERLKRQDRLNVLIDLLQRIRDHGVLVGLSAHDPTLIEIAEDQGWDVDYYMASLYYLTRPREEFEAILGPDLPLGEIYLPSDPPRMFGVIQSASKPCLTYKVLAAGRRVSSASEVRQCFETAFNQLKPTDAVIIGMYQQLGDQVGENAAIVREIGSQ